ncbi:type II toxin-antitoxin system PemK/MazF family toxin [Citrobacter portucalensis]|uniref:type II toxin-antitoxin system PemK/MazF family toxin n=1 Tax=Citrobacter portucalensis TaxID=1639133 RepID=UPI0015E9402C|nr:type II toxin-antitoxin system PemK/MazF family toxin [Citrobacter portucalensis]EIP1106121.1 type II toxin-antitoxin system PemK/MazF family toxin [Citrobacter freundii]MBA8563183.1 type II toxin-antitoxin system PemK/MazF family toxin [Citrobacter freundii]MCX8972198.1 type II toxin-antitoxin system PemK/MazF family toxin [Citrobacter portucalensis]QMN66375.1 type II toxin-antitoxin system PemK/MazF family toxin [Citrobacter freundii]WOR31064.1 type II toxin-antitoxin system PemK/MazF fam
MAQGRKTPAKGEIWHVNGDPVEGHEFKGAHYYLVVSDRNLVSALGTAVCVPITSGGASARSHAVTVYLDGDSTDTGRVTGVVLCYQLRALDLVARKASYTARVAPHIMDEILGMVVDLIDPQ